MDSASNRGNQNTHIVDKIRAGEANLMFNNEEDKQTKIIQTLLHCKIVIVVAKHLLKNNSSGKSSSYKNNSSYFLSKKGYDLQLLLKIKPLCQKLQSSD